MTGKIKGKFTIEQAHTEHEALQLRKLVTAGTETIPLENRAYGELTLRITINRADACNYYAHDSC
jgi:hypothetical protein